MLGRWQDLVTSRALIAQDLIEATVQSFAVWPFPVPTAEQGNQPRHLEGLGVHVRKAPQLGQDDGHHDRTLDAPVQHGIMLHSGTRPVTSPTHVLNFGLSAELTSVQPPNVLCNSTNASVGVLNVNIVRGNMVISSLTPEELRTNASALPSVVGYGSQNALILTDALGETITLPWSIVRTYDDLQDCLERHFRGRAGEDYVLNGMFCIAETNGGTVIAADDWQAAVDGSERMIMSILLEQLMLEELRNHCPRCGKTNLGTYEDQGWRVCRRCNARFILPGMPECRELLVGQAEDHEIALFRHVRKLEVDEPDSVGYTTSIDNDTMRATIEYDPYSSLFFLSTPISAKLVPDSAVTAVAEDKEMISPSVWRRTYIEMASLDDCSPRETENHFARSSSPSPEEPHWSSWLSPPQHPVAQVQAQPHHPSQPTPTSAFATMTDPSSPGRKAHNLKVSTSPNPLKKSLIQASPVAFSPVALQAGQSSLTPATVPPTLPVSPSRSHLRLPRIDTSSMRLKFRSRRSTKAG